MYNLKIKTEDGFILDADFTQVEGSTKAIIFVHGMTVNRKDETIFVRAEPRLNELGFSTMMFDFRSHGQSSGIPIKDFTISGEIKDLEAIVKFMSDKGLTWIGIAGASFGGSIVSIYSGKNPSKIKALFLAYPVLNYETAFLNPITTWGKKYFEKAIERIRKEGFIKVGSRQFKMGRKIFEEMRKYKPCTELQKFPGPIIIVHGDRDEHISCQSSIDCFNNLPSKNKRLEVIEGAAHGLEGEPYESEATNLVVQFFLQQADS